MRRRLILFSLAIASVAVFLFALPLTFIDRDRQRDESGNELLRLAATAALRAESGGRSADLAGVPFRPPGRTDVALGLYGRDGRQVKGDGPPVLDTNGRTPPDQVLEFQDGGERVVIVPILEGDRVLGAVRAAERVDVLAARLRRTLIGLVGLGVGILVLAAALAASQARRFTRPLDRLRTDAGRIGDGDFTIVPATSGVAEIDAIGTALSSAGQRIGELVSRSQAFAADASHQLRTPLTGLRIVLEGELAHPRNDPRDALQEALVQVDRLDRTVESLLALAREEGTDRPLVSLDGVVRRAEGRWRPFFSRQQRLLVARIGPCPTPARAREIALLHVLDVLLDNALQHGAGTVTLELRCDMTGARIVVSDQGPGVADPGAVFQRRQPGATGTGIGLALARRLAEAEGAMLRLLPTRIGAAFELRLPLTSPAPGGGRSGGTGGEGVDPAPGGGEERVGVGAEGAPLHRHGLLGEERAVVEHPVAVEVVVGGHLEERAVFQHDPQVAGRDADGGLADAAHVGATDEGDGGGLPGTGGDAAREQHDGHGGGEGDAVGGQGPHPPAVDAQRAPVHAPHAATVAGVGLAEHGPVAQQGGERRELRVGPPARVPPQVEHPPAR